MIELVAARADMVTRLRLQNAQLIAGDPMTPETVEWMIANGLALAAIDGDVVIGIAGIFERWDGCGAAWALLAKNIGPNMTTIHRITQRVLDAHPFRRVEAYVVEGYPEGHRWMSLLGFTKEGVMNQFHQGQDYGLYARVR